ncbi:MAG: DNA gyrase subunit A [Anaerolineae bacterium]
MDIGAVKLVNIEREVREAYLDYAMSVITSRALPDARDGLKPVQRRILYTMYDNGLRPDRAYRKSAATVGDVLGKYHPHGDSAVYDAMVRLAQDFSMRYPLVDGQGNFGSIDGDPPAAYRYTEARPARTAMEMLADIDMDTVDTRPNFDDTRQEPTVLPARIPNLLVNGASGIAVGMATNIPPHNLGEVCDALCHLIDHWDAVEDITPEDLRHFIPGPDFPTGATILGLDGIKSAYGTGRGRVLIRSRAHVEEIRPGREAVIVTEIPFQVNKTTLLERIADLVRSRKIETISDLRDESDRHGIRIVIEIKRNGDPHITLNQLYKYSMLQHTFGVNMLALVDGEPQVLSLKRLLEIYVNHRIDVVERRTRYELERARQRQHILEGLRIAIAHLDEVIATIRRSPDVPEAKANLISGFSLSEVQAQAILDMQLRRLAALEQEKIEEEYKAISERIAYLESLLQDRDMVLAVIRAEIQALKEAYGDPRRTTIEADARELADEDLIPIRDTLITVTQRGYIKRLPTDTYRSQQRGGRGIIGARTKMDDQVRDNFIAGTRDTLLFFTDRGRVFQMRAWQVPETSRESAGTPLVNLIQLTPGERVTVALPVKAETWLAGGFLVMATERGRIKRTVLSAYESVRSSGLIAIVLDEGDTLRWVKATTGKGELIMVTRRGRALRFREQDVRPMGRAAAGVMAIRLKESDAIATMDLVDPDADLLVITERGVGKRSPLSQYRTTSRHTQGIMTLAAGRVEEIGEIVDARVVSDGGDLALITAAGIVMRTTTDAISRMSRITRGVIIMRPDEGDRVASLAYWVDRSPAAETDETEAFETEAFETETGEGDPIGTALIAGESDQGELDGVTGDDETGDDGIEDDETGDETAGDEDAEDEVVADLS